MSLTLTRRHNVDRFGYLIPHRYGNLPMVGAVATYRPGEGRFGGAVAVEEGTTNLIDPLAVMIRSNRDDLYPVQDEPFGGHRRVRRNPDFETYPDGRLSTYTQAFYDHDAGIYTRSIKVKPERDVFLRLDISGEIVLCKAGIWTTLIDVIEHAEQGRSRFPGIFTAPTESFGFDFNPWIEYKEAQVEAKPFATSFVDGTRAAGRLEYPGSVLSLDEATLICWVKAHEGSPDQRRDIWAINSSVSSDDRLILGRNITGSGWGFFFRPVGGNLSELRHNVPLDFGWHMIGFRYRHNASSDRYDLALIFDGDIVATGTSSTPGRLTNISRLYSDGGSAYAANCLIDELLILPYAASEEEIASWYEAQGPLPPHPQASLQWDRQTVRPAQMVKL